MHIWITMWLSESNTTEDIVDVKSIALHRDAKEVRHQRRLTHGSLCSLERREGFVVATFNDGYRVAVPMTSISFIELGDGPWERKPAPAAKKKGKTPAPKFRRSNPAESSAAS